MTTVVPRFSAIDVTALPKPALIEELDAEAIIADMRDEVLERLPWFSGVSLETGPAAKIIEALAYREVLLRAMVNDKARAVLVAYSTGTDLDHLAAFYKIERRILVPANEDTGEEAVYEGDDEFRQRVALAPEAFTVAGSEGAYQFFAWSAHPDIKDVGVYKVAPGRIQVSLLSRYEDGAVDTETALIVANALSVKNVRPLTDDVQVAGSAIVPVDLEIHLLVGQGADLAVVEATADASVRAYFSSIHKVGAIMRTDGVLAAARVGGVEKASITSHDDDVDPAYNGTIWLNSLEFSITRLS